MISFPISPALQGDDVTFRPAPLRPEAFLEPFYDDGVLTHGVPGPRANRLSLDEYPEPVGHIPIKAIIFHLSHCGSTLLSQLLSLKHDHRVVSEAEIINSVLLSHVFYSPDEKKTISRLQKAMSMLLQPLSGSETGAFVKLTSWNLFHAGLIRRAFPGIPVWYVHRDPAQVILSLTRQPHGFATWNQHGEPILACKALGLSKEKIRALTQTDFIGHMLLKHLQCVSDVLPADTLFFSYPEWIAGFPDMVQPVFAFTKMEMALVRERLGFNAKQPDTRFSTSRSIHTVLPMDIRLNELLGEANAAVYRKWQTSIRS